MGIRTAVQLALALAMITPAWAHENHGKKEEHAGHAAALGRPGVASKVTRTVRVSMTDDMRFKPSAIAVKRNETIRFVVTNAGRIRHELVLGTQSELKEHAALMQKFPEMEHDDPNAVSVEPGKTGSFVWQFTRAGRFDFACLQPGHFEAGMLGTIAVK